MWSLIKKQSKSDVSYIPGVLWDKVIGFADEPLVQCDVAAVKNTALDDDDNDDHKYFFFYLGFLSQPFTNHRTAGERGGGAFF